MDSNAPAQSGVSFVTACDVCGQPVTAEDCFEAELTAGGATCPTALKMHKACYDAASALWVPEDPDSTCTYDPLFPETGKWMQMQQDQSESVSGGQA